MTSDEVKKAAEEYAESLGDCYNRFMIDADFIPSIFCAGYAHARRWILTSERLPEFGEDVLVVDRNGDIHLVCLSRVSGWTTGEHDLEEGDITHWQPLPPAPKGEK